MDEIKRCFEVICEACAVYDELMRKVERTGENVAYVQWEVSRIHNLIDCQLTPQEISVIIHALKTSTLRTTREPILEKLEKQKELLKNDQD